MTNASSRKTSRAISSSGKRTSSGNRGKSAQNTNKLNQTKNPLRQTNNLRTNTTSIRGGSLNNDDNNDDNISPTSSYYDKTFQKEINGMLLLSFCDVFNNEQLNENFNMCDLDLVEVLTWIRQSTVGPSRQIVQLRKPRNFTRMKNSTISKYAGVVYNELETRHVSQSFHAALPIRNYASKN